MLTRMKSAFKPLGRKAEKPMGESTDIPTKKLLMFAQSSVIFNLFGMQKHNVTDCAIQKY